MEVEEHIFFSGLYSPNFFCKKCLSLDNCDSIYIYLIPIQRYPWEEKWINSNGVDNCLEWKEAGANEENEKWRGQIEKWYMGKWGEWGGIGKIGACPTPTSCTDRWLPQTTLACSGEIARSQVLDLLLLTFNTSSNIPITIITWTNHYNTMNKSL